ncbi:MAG TPA: HipA domain-containing protein, partial [Acidimicrobiales bacterium]
MSAPSLGIWWDGRHVADIRQGRRGLDLTYTTDAIERWPGNAPVLSCSLPLGRRPMDGTWFARGLLPEGQALASAAARAGVAATDTLGLLAAYGRDVAGALVIAESPPAERIGDVVPYGPSDLDDEVARLAENPLGLHDDSELSLAGLQDKLLLVGTPDAGWGRPRHGSPSTHILKADDLRRPGLVRAEGAALHLARMLGLTTVDATLEAHADRECLIVSRFDREVRDGVVRRLHQEDLCQATATDLSMGRGRGK